MSIASMSSFASIAARIVGVHGSAPKMPIDSEQVFGSMLCRSISSAIASMYDGVTMMMSGLKSVMSCTCFSVCPPDMGMTVAPSFSAP
jgi:hypothetical protein